MHDQFPRGRADPDPGRESGRGAGTPEPPFPAGQAARTFHRSRTLPAPDRLFMITAKRIVNYVGAEPFRPFRITTTSGRTYDIRHPEMVQVGRSTMTIFMSMSDDEDAAKEREVEVSLLLTESVEPLDVAARPQGTS